VRNLLKEQFGVELPEIKFYLGGKNRVYVYKSCEFDDIAFQKGFTLVTMEKDGLRLSIEGSFIVGKIAKKNVIELDAENFRRWMRGEDVEAGVEGYYIVKCGNYFAGCGKGNGRILKNLFPRTEGLLNFDNYT